MVRTVHTVEEEPGAPADGHVPRLTLAGVVVRRALEALEVCEQALEPVEDVGATLRELVACRKSHPRFGRLLEDAEYDGIGLPPALIDELLPREQTGLEGLHALPVYAEQPVDPPHHVRSALVLPVLLEDLLERALGMDPAGRMTLLRNVGVLLQSVAHDAALVAEAPVVVHQNIGGAPLDALQPHEDMRAPLLRVIRGADLEAKPGKEP